MSKCLTKGCWYGKGVAGEMYEMSIGVYEVGLMGANHNDTSFRHPFTEGIQQKKVEHSIFNRPNY